MVVAIVLMLAVTIILPAAAAALWIHRWQTDAPEWLWLLFW